MVMPTKPALVKSFNKESWGFVLAATTTAPTVAQLTAAAGINLTCYLFGDQESLTVETEKVTLPRLMCEATVYQSNGPTTYSMADLQATFNPQAAAASDGKKAYEKLLEGTAGYLWRRQGLAPDTDVAAAQFVDLVPVDIGPGTPDKSSTDASGVFTSKHSFSVTGRPTFNIAVAA